MTDRHLIWDLMQVHTQRSILRHNLNQRFITFEADLNVGEPAVLNIFFLDKTNIYKHIFIILGFDM